MTRIMKIAAILSFILSINIYALVDYTEQEFKAPQISSPSKKVRRVTGRVPRRSGRSSGSAIIRSFSFNGAAESQKVNIEQTTKKVNKYLFNLNVQTTYNLFINIDHFMASSKSDLLADSNDTQSGNTKVKIGFNWLRFGKAHEMATVDLYGGMMLKGDSDFASSRSDQIIGIETTKRFDQLAFGLGYEFTITGDPKNIEESKVGNINRFQVALGWRVSNDINLALEANYTKIQANDNDGQETLLSKGFTFGHITPKVSLRLGKFVGLDFGGVFRTKKVSIDQSLLNAKLWDLQGLYGNSVFAGMNIIF